MNVQLKIEEVRNPTIMAPDEVVVRVGAAGLCRTDLHIIEGVWKDIMDTQGTLLPYIMGHENAGWIEDVGSGVKSVKPGDAVICHPLRSCGICLNCRYGEDMYCAHGLFPGLGLDGGFAEYFITNERALIKLNPNITPIDVAPMADAGITAYRAAKRAAKLLRPGAYCVLLGMGGLGHIALQCLQAISGCRIIAIDRVPAAQALAKELGADFVLDGGPDIVEQVREITGGGAQVVIDFVGELGVENLCWQMVRKGGQMFVVGYGGNDRGADRPFRHRGDQRRRQPGRQLHRAGRADGAQRRRQGEDALQRVQAGRHQHRARRFQEPPLRRPWRDRTGKWPMKALIYNGPGLKAVEDRPMPRLQSPTDAVVRVTKTTICGTDLHILKGDVPDLRAGPHPRP